MNIEKAIKILEDHNEWRRGDEDLEMTNPTELGIAIDLILQEFKKLDLAYIKDTSKKNDKAMQHEPVLCAVLLDWFDKNYIETREECERLVIEGTIDYPFTPEKLKEGCVELEKTIIENESLYIHIKLIGYLCSVGVSASITGEKIREVINKTAIWQV